MNQVYLALLSALAGGIITAAVSIITLIVQSRSAARRERFRLVAQVAMEDYKLRLDKAGNTSMVPAASYLWHYMQIIEAIEDGKLTPERFKEIATKDKQLIVAIHEMAK